MVWQREQWWERFKGLLHRARRRLAGVWPVVGEGCVRQELDTTVGRAVILLDTAAEIKGLPCQQLRSLAGLLQKLYKHLTLYDRAERSVGQCTRKISLPG